MASHLTVRPNQGAQLTQRSFKTKAKLVVHRHRTSHQAYFGNPIVITEDIQSFTTNGLIQNIGKCEVRLTPRINYLNLIQPNDYVNLYINRGDGEGWVRTFFGLVDQIMETFSVNNKGIPNTFITLTCSDFNKVFKSTEIYFNPHLAGRKDVTGEFIGTPNVGGLALYTKGIAIIGSPPDIVLQLIFALLGAGAQFRLPDGYSSLGKNKLRLRRVEFAINRLSEDIKSALPDGGESFFKALREQESSYEEAVADKTLDPSDTDINSRVKKLTTMLKVLQKVNKSAAESQEPRVTAITQAAVSDKPLSFLDILDVFTFVERETIDGYIDGTALLTQQGSLLSAIKANSNELVNEVFFDLRAVVDSPDGALAEGEWLREPDEIGGNVDASGDVVGVKYVPALVFREYPFSTINYLDGNKLPLAFKDEKIVEILGDVQFGSIFATSPNVPGRHILPVSTINYEDLARGKTAKVGIKHIDVAVIDSSEIISYSWGRSDAQHTNFIGIVSDSIHGVSAKYFVQDLLPIISPIHVMKNGLRVKIPTTKFARLGLAIAQKVSSAGKTVKEPEETADSKEAPAPTETGTVTYPLDSSVVSKISRYGYRKKEVTSNEFSFHGGIDLYATKGTPVKAIASGLVVAVLPSGQFSHYGNSVLIKHFEPFQGKPVYSFYAHMSGFEPSLQAKTNPRLRMGARAFSPEFKANGKMVGLPIVAGTVIGYVGNTAGTPENPDALFATSAPHLHLEIRKDTTFTKVSKEFPAIPKNQPIPTVTESAHTIDPDVYFAGVGLGTFPLQQVDDSSEETLEDVVTAGAREDDSPVHKESETTPAPSEKAKYVQRVSVKKQLIRWGLLMDHWFQHNNEYLNGTITMVGAPEIRVGYRLDIRDKNLSFYVQGVRHVWNYPGAMITTLVVTRGQPNNPFPLYVLPGSFTQSETQRVGGGRLDEAFNVPDNQAVKRGVAYNRIKSLDAESISVNDIDDPSLYHEQTISAPTYAEPREAEQSEIEKLVDQLLSDDEEASSEALTTIMEGIVKSTDSDE